MGDEEGGGVLVEEEEFGGEGVRLRVGEGRLDGDSVLDLEGKGVDDLDIVEVKDKDTEEDAEILHIKTTPKELKSSCKTNPGSPGPIAFGGILSPPLTTLFDVKRSVE